MVRETKGPPAKRARIRPLVPLSDTPRINKAIFDTEFCCNYLNLLVRKRESNLNPNNLKLKIIFPQKIFYTNKYTNRILR